MLQKDLEPLGKALLRGTWKDIASAAFKVKQLKSELLKSSLKEISKESSSLASSKNPSLLRKVDVDNLAKLSLEMICLELRDCAPFMYSVLMTVATPSCSIRGSCQWLPSVAAAGSILLKERSGFLNGFQLLLTMCIKTHRISGL